MTKQNINTQIDQVGIVLCYALIAYDEDLISEDVMNCYRDTFAPEITALFQDEIEELRETIRHQDMKAQYHLNYGNDGGL